MTNVTIINCIREPINGGVYYHYEIHLKDSNDLQTFTIEGEYSAPELEDSCKNWKLSNYPQVGTFASDTEALEELIKVLNNRN